MKPPAPVRPELIRVLKPGLDGGTDDTRKLFIVAFDPGVRTGWCVMRFQLEALRCYGFRAVVCSHPDPDLFAWASGYFDGPEPYQAELMMALMRGTWMHGEGVFDAGVESDLFIGVMEAFSLREFSRDDSLLSPVRIRSSFEMLAWRSLSVPVLTPGPSDAMRVFTDARLKAFNLWSGVDGKEGEHQRDATRHAGIVARNVASSSEWLSKMCNRMAWLHISKK